MEEKPKKIRNFVETLSGHLCRSVLIFMFLGWIVLFQLLNEFQNHVSCYPFFMPQVASVMLDQVSYQEGSLSCGNTLLY